MMRKVLLLHNPTAGDEAHSKEKLMQELESAGYKAEYFSAKEDAWKTLDGQPRFIAVAGGDGTIGKVARHLLGASKGAEFPIAVLPLGTANNIAKTFAVDFDTTKAIADWKDAMVKKVDVGSVSNVPEASFFLEGVGFGIFPYLMKAMKEAQVEYDSPEAELNEALKRLHQILLEYEPRHCHLSIDGTDHSGKFYMVEVMNIKSIGPNVMLAPLADPGDGEFEVVLIPEAHKEKFSDYLVHRIADGNDAYHFHTLKAKNITIQWDGTRIHVDDKMLKLEKQTEVSIQIVEGALSFLAPAARRTAEI